MRGEFVMGWDKVKLEAHLYPEPKPIRLQAALGSAGIERAYNPYAEKIQTIEVRAAKI